MQSTRPRAPVFCLLGSSLDTGNMGVSALAASLAKIIIDAVPGADLYLFIGCQSDESQHLVVGRREVEFRVLNYRLSLRSGIRNHLLYLLLLAGLYRLIPSKRVRAGILERNTILGVLAVADFIGDIHGGDSFSDIYGLRRFLIGALPNIIVLLLGRKLVQLPQTYGPFKTFLARKLSSAILRRSDRVFTRDAVYFGRSRSEGAWDGVRENVEFCPDVAFMLEPHPPRALQIVPGNPVDSTTTLVGVNVNGLLLNGESSGRNPFDLKIDYGTFLSLLVDRLLAIPATRVLLVPHVFGSRDSDDSDSAACERVYRSKGGRDRSGLFLLQGEYDQNEIKAVIGKCDFFVGSRMHACIAALSQGVPAVGIAYSDKFAGVFESVGFGDMIIDARTCEAVEAVQRVLRHFQERRVFGKRMGNVVERAREAIRGAFASMLPGVHRERPRVMDRGA